MNRRRASNTPHLMTGAGKCLDDAGPGETGTAGDKNSGALGLRTVMPRISPGPRVIFSL
jgi:hypothetical protein